MDYLKGLVGGGYEAPALAVDHQRCINLLVEIDKDGKTPASLYGVPGLSRLMEAAGGAAKAGIVADGVLYMAIGQSFGSVDAGFTAFTPLGSFAGAGRVTLVQNGLQVLVIDGLSGWVWDIADATWTQITAPGFVYGATQATYQDGYGIVALPNSQQFGISGLYDFTAWAAIDFASAEGLPDNVASVISNHRVLHIFGTDTTELWINSGDSAFPFQRIDGTFYDVGCAAPYTVAVADDSVFWLGNNPQGAKAIYRMQGQSPLRISTEALENEIKRYARIDDAYAVGIDIRKHPIYLITFPTAGKTWIYDAHSGLWSEMLEWVGAEWKQYRLNCFVSAYGKLVVGDYRSGRLYHLDFDVYSNDGDSIRRVRVSPFVFDKGRLIRHSRMEVFMDPGVGLPIGYGQEPLLGLRWSDDGYTWSSEIFQSFGRLGEYGKRAIFNRLGAGRNRIYELSCDAPVRVVILGAALSTA